MLSGIKIAATLHKFHSDRDSLDHGNEPELVATCAITKNIGLLAIYATFTAERLSGVTNIPWLQFEQKF